MTATLRPPARRPSDPGARPVRRRPPASGTHRTLVALVASGLGVVPLKGLFSDTGWLVDVWLSMIVVLAPAALLRLRRAPGALDIWPGIALLVPWLTARFLGETAFAGIIPTGATGTQLSTLLSQLHETTRNEVAPIHTTPAVRLVICALLALLAALIDLIAVVGHRAALGGVPLLVVYTVAGAVPRQPVAWVWFVFGAVAFLMLLALDSGDDLDRWGRRVRSPGGGRAARTALAVAAPRIAVVSVVIAVALPIVLPGDPRNLIANAFHGNGDDVAGFGGGSGGKITPFAALQGQLQRNERRDLADVQMLGPGDAKPYYLRANVLSDYTDEGWRPDSHGPESSIGDDEYPILSEGDVPTESLTARVTVSGLRDNPPVFATPTDISGLPDDTTWSSQDQILLGSTVDDDTEFVEQFDQPAPSIQQLQDATGDVPEEVRSQLEVPSDLPKQVRDTVARETSGRTTPYAKARAISEFFADPKNNFVYDLQTTPDDSGSALVSFLNNKRGFCQQFAGAMAIMLRVADVPARVVLGYLHAPPNADGRFSITTDDAHAWVEAWFPGIGWTPFDPTPAAGRSTDTQPYEPTVATRPSSTPGTRPSSSATSSGAAVPSTSAAPSPGTRPDADAPSDGGVGNAPWYALGGFVVLLAALSPASLRALRRRRRMLAARRGGDAEALWAELSDSAVDLGYVWSDSRSPRQVAAWLGKDAPGAAEPLGSLASVVERGRYSADAAGGRNGRGPSEHDRGVTREAAGLLPGIVGQLRERRSGRTRLRALLLPPSLRRRAADDPPPRPRRTH